jgi:Ca2+-transporting ATPase
MEVPLLEAAGADEVARLRAARPRLAALPFDAERRRMAVLHDGVAGPELFVKGAPEAVIPLCATAMTADETVRSLDPTEAEHLLAAAGTAALEGVRVLAVARRTFGPATQVPALEVAERDLTFEALVGLRDPIRPEARAAVDEAGGAGIRILMATGDHPGTASAVAREVGLCAPDCRPVTGGELRLRGVPEDPLATAVYARVEPEQKLDLVEALQRRSLVVAMTGDGVNDAPALHTADIGVALGARGSDVAREAADMVITDDNLATIVVAVREGRGIYDNIRKVIDYLIAGNLSEISVVVAALLLFPGLGVPLLPVQLLWVNLLTDGLPAIALGLDRAHPTLMADPPRRREAQLLGPRRVGLLAARGAAIAAACIAALALDLGWGQPVEHARTVLFTTLVTAHMAYAFVARRRPTRVKGREPGIGGWFGTPLLVAAVGGGLALQWVIVTWSVAHGVFGTVALDARDWILIVAAALAGVAGTVAVPRPPTPLSPEPATDPSTGPAAGETRAA